MRSSYKVKKEQQQQQKVETTSFPAPSSHNFLIKENN